MRSSGHRPRRVAPDRAKQMVRVFISYSHDKREHLDRVLDLSNRLRREGVDCRVDQYEESPPEGWPNWCSTQVEEAEFVLVVCTATYERRFRGKEERGKGLGATWEGFVITQELYDSQGRNTKFIPVILSVGDSPNIPTLLRGATRYDLSSADDYEALYRRLTRQPAVVMPELGDVRSKGPCVTEGAVPELLRKQEFRETDITNGEMAFSPTPKPDGKAGSRARYVLLASVLTAVCLGCLLYETSVYLTRKKAELDASNHPPVRVDQRVPPPPNRSTVKSTPPKPASAIEQHGSSNIQNASIRQGNNGNIQQVTGTGNTVQNCPNGKCTIVQGAALSVVDIAEDTTSLIRRLTDNTADSERLIAFWYRGPQSNATVAMRNNGRDKFDKVYRENYWPSVDKTYKELIGHIVRVPSPSPLLRAESRAELFTLHESPVTTEDVEDELIDLCSLLCEMQVEHDLPTTCSPSEIITKLDTAGHQKP
jgi:hypothetical protein